jgi:hypothetical protein
MEIQTLILGNLVPELVPSVKAAARSHNGTALVKARRDQ